MDEKAEFSLKGRLSTLKIVVMVVAAAAPAGAIIGITPLSFALGSGASTPAVFIAAGLVLICFSVGYAAMSRRVSGAGGFYTYVARGIGRPPAVGAALVAVIAYNAMVLLLVAGLGYYGAMVLQVLAGVTVPWWILAAAGIAIVGFLGYRQIDVAGSVLAVLLVVEVGVLVALDIAIIAHKGLDAFPTAAIDPRLMFSTGSIGLGLMFAFQSFVGFESAAIYAEETKDPDRSVGRAIYFSVVAIAVFYALTTWVTVGALGVGQTQSAAQKQLGALYFGLSDQYASALLTKLMYITLITSLFASLMALHNATSRYMFAVGRERTLLPARFGSVHAKHGSPARASLLQTSINLVVLAVFAAAGLDPYLNMATTMTGLGTLGVVLLQGAAAVAIVSYFWRHRQLTVRIAAGSIIGVLAFVTVAVLIVKNFQTLTGSTSQSVNVLPWLLVAAAVFGTAYGLWLRKARPRTYAGIGEFDHPEAHHAELQTAVPAGE